MARAWLAFALAWGGLCFAGAAQAEPAGGAAHPAHGNARAVHGKTYEVHGKAAHDTVQDKTASGAGVEAHGAAHARDDPRARAGASSPSGAKAGTNAGAGANTGASTYASTRANTYVNNARAYIGGGNAATVDYVTQPGDSLYSIASRYLRDTGNWVSVARIDKVALPRRLQPGSTLHLPVALLRQVNLSGKVIAASGPVSLARRAGAFAPLVIASGAKGNANGAQSAASNASDTTLTEGDRIQTGNEGFATLELPDGSHLVVRPGSLLEISVLRRTVLTGAFDRVITLRRGEVRNEVTRATKRDDRFQIRSPSVVAGVRGTSFRVRYDEDGATAVEVLDGAVGVGSIGGAGRAGNAGGVGGAGSVGSAGNAAKADHPDPASAGNPGINNAARQRDSVATATAVRGEAMSLLRDDAQLVSAGHGNVTRADGQVGLPRALLGAPELIRSSRVQDEPDVVFDARPLAGAQRYRVLIGRDAGLLDPVREAISDGGTRVVVAGPLEDGTYFARVSAVDTQGLEGMSGTYAFERRRMTLSASAAAIAGTRNYAFRWQMGEAGKTSKTRFRFVLATTQDLRAPLVDRPDLPGSELTVSDLPPSTYYWTVIAEQFDHGRLYEKNGAVQSFRIEP